MKKLLKSFLSMIAVVAMVLSLTTVVNAATVTVPENSIISGHTFTAYQVFTGDEHDGVLSNVKWGSGIKSNDFLTALQADTTTSTYFGACITAADVAEVLGNNNVNTALANAVAKLAYANKTETGTVLNSPDTILADGYYLIVDTTNSVGEGGAYNAALLKIVGDQTLNIQLKTDAPTVEKKVLENVKYTKDEGYGTGYNDVADYNMGDAVTFHLIGSVPDMSRYDTYKYIFHDTLSAGLTLDKNSIKVYLSNDKIKDDDDVITSHFSINSADAGTDTEITVSCDNLKAIDEIEKGQYIIVEYTATLNQNAVVGLDGNPNEVYLEYSNKPDQSGLGESNNTGETPKDIVIVFTYELDTTKVDGQDNAEKLKGAEFVLYKKINNIEYFAIVDDNNKVKEWKQLTAVDEVQSYPEDSILTSDEKGLFKVIGLDDGTYYLKETKAPEGYNLLSEDIEIVITATTTNGQTWTDGVASSALTNLAVTADGTPGNGDRESGIAGITVKNTKGSTLPETGGIGNYVFYGVGGVLMMGAAYYFVRKRTGKNI